MYSHTYTAISTSSHEQHWFVQTNADETKKEWTKYQKYTWVYIHTQLYIYIYVYMYINPNLVARAAFTRAEEEVRKKQTNSWPNLKVHINMYKYTHIFIYVYTHIAIRTSVFTRAAQEARKKGTNSWQKCESIY